MNTHAYLWKVSYANESFILILYMLNQRRLGHIIYIEYISNSNIWKKNCKKFSDDLDFIMKLEFYVNIN